MLREYSNVRTFQNFRFIQKFIMLAKLILLLCSVYIIKCLNYTLYDLTEFNITPYAAYKQTLNISDNTTTLKTFSYQNYFYRLGSDGVIKVWDTSNQTSYQLICNVSSPFVIQDFGINRFDGVGQFVYVDGNKNVKIIYPSNCSLNGSFTVNYSTINAQIYISYIHVFLAFSSRASDRGIERLFQYYRSNLTLKDRVSFSDRISADSIRFAYCTKPQSMNEDAEFFFIYNQSSYYFLWGNNKWSSFGYDRVDSAPPNNLSWTIKSATFNHDCGFITLVHGAPLNKVTIVYHDKTKFINEVNFTTEPKYAVQFDQKKWMIAVFFGNNTVGFYNVSNTTTANNGVGQVNVLKNFTYLFNLNFEYNITVYNPFAAATSKFYLTTDNFSQSYKLECPSGIRLGMGLCLDVFDEAVQSNSQTTELKYLFTCIKVMALMIVFMQMTPFVSVFLRFINFWTICSVYSMVEVKTRQPLTSIMYQIYKLINASLFQLLGIGFEVSISQQEKVTSKYFEEYDITSNFAPIIIQPLMLTFIMCILLYCFEYVKHKFFSQNNKKKFKTNKLKIFFGQYVSFLSVFMFPLKFVFLNMNQLQPSEKLNQSLHMVFIWMGFMLPFILVFLNGTKMKIQTKTGKMAKSVGYFTQKSIKDDNNVKLVQHKVSVLTFEYLQFTYISLVNIFMPILGTLTNPLYFCIISGALIVCGIIVDTKRSEWKVNSIILSSELLLFHFCFCLELATMSERGKYIVSIIGLTVLMIGAVHEILTVVVRILVDLYDLFCKGKTKVQDEETQKKIQVKMKSNIQVKEHVKNKKSTEKDEEIHQNNIKLVKKETIKPMKDSKNQRQKVVVQDISKEHPYKTEQPQAGQVPRNPYRFISMKSKILKKRTERIKFQQQPKPSSNVAPIQQSKKIEKRQQQIPKTKPGTMKSKLKMKISHNGFRQQ